MQNGSHQPSFQAAAESFRRFTPALVIILYASSVISMASHHEPWFDEGQSWLLARDASPLHLILHLLRYEGHPPLWHLLLMPFAKAGMPYRFLPVLSAVLASGGIALLALHPRIPAAWKWGIPSGFYLAYQYSVVARSYVLIFPLLMGLFWIWPSRWKRIWLFLSLLALLGLVSVHGLAMSVAVGAYSLWDPEVRAQWTALPFRTRCLAGLAALVFLAALVAILYPPGDLAFKSRVNFSPDPVLILSSALEYLTISLTGSTWLGTLALPFILWWLHRRGQLVLALAMVGAVAPICAVYFNQWHQGIYFLALLLPVLLAAARTPPQELNPWPRRLAVGSFCLIGLHLLWGTIRAYAWDLSNPYSGSRRIADLLRDPVSRGESVAAIGFTSLSVEPYFKSNIYRNYRIENHASYWTWGTPTPLYYATTQDTIPADLVRWTESQLQSAPDWIVVSMKFPQDPLYLQTVQKDGHYEVAAVAPGRMVWKQDPDEVDSFVLFHRIASPGPGASPVARPREGDPTPAGQRHQGE